MFLWCLVLGIWSLTRRRRVCHHPRDRRFEFLQLYRLDQMFREPGCDALCDIGVHPETADGNATNGAGGAKNAEQIHSVAVGQTDVADQQVERIARACFLESCAHAVDGYDKVAAKFEQALQRGTGIGMIVDE